MDKKDFLEETIMMSQIFVLRKRIKEFQEGFKQPFSVDGQLRLSKIQREVRKILRIQNNWSCRENNIYNKVFPRVPRTN